MTEETTAAELTAAQRLASNLIAAIGLILCGVFLLLCGLGAIALDMTSVLAPAILTAFGIVLLANALIQSNTVSLYLSVLLFVCALTCGIANFSENIGYGELYPLFIAAPAAASVVTIIMSRNFMTHIKIILVSGVFAFVFFMQSFGIWSWVVTVPVLVMLTGLLALYATLSAKARPEE